MTHHKMTVEVDFDIDEGDVICSAAEILADRVEQNTWYCKIRNNVDAMVLDEVRARVSERIALALERGVTDGEGFQLRHTPGFPNAKTGEGGDWYETISIEQFIRQEVERQVLHHVSRIAEGAARQIVKAQVEE